MLNDLYFRHMPAIPQKAMFTVYWENLRKEISFKRVDGEGINQVQLILARRNTTVFFASTRMHTTPFADLRLWELFSLTLLVWLAQIWQSQFLESQRVGKFVGLGKHQEISWIFNKLPSRTSQVVWGQGSDRISLGCFLWNVRDCQDITYHRINQSTEDIIHTRLRVKGLSKKLKPCPPPIFCKRQIRVYQDILCFTRVLL